MADLDKHKEAAQENKKKLKRPNVPHKPKEGVQSIYEEFPTADINKKKT